MSRISGVRSFALAGLLLTAGVLMPSVVGAGGPAQPDWFLNQNEPNPFCPEFQVTTIEFALAQQSNVVLRVWDEGMSMIIWEIVLETAPAGYFSVQWDGTDSGGVEVGEGDYPYVLTATDPEGGVLLFEDSRVARVCCSASPIDPGTWSRIKDLYRSEK